VNLKLFLPYVALILGGLGGALLVVFLAATLVPDRWLRAEPRGTLAEADVFIAFGLGLGRAPDGGETPGASNAAIARWASGNRPLDHPKQRGAEADDRAGRGISRCPALVSHDLQLQRMVWNFERWELFFARPISLLVHQ
jgi:hypothetical protein